MSYEEWRERYKPIRNPYASAIESRAYEGCMFETYGPEVQLVQIAEQHHVWTLLDDDQGTVLVSGRHFVNRLGYFITVEPWTQEHVEVRDD